MKYHIANQANIASAVKALREKKVIIHSTDTIPGLACDATSDKAIQTIIELKNRRGPFSIIVECIKDIKKYSTINDKQLEIISNLLPGPFTILSKNNKNNNLSKLATKDSELIGFRIPNHAFTNNLIKEFKNPIVTTSVNTTGQESIINLKEIPENFKHILVYDDEKRKLSKGSTILNFSNKKVTIVRYGDGKYQE